MPRQVYSDRQQMADQVETAPTQVLRDLVRSTNVQPLGQEQLHQVLRRFEGAVTAAAAQGPLTPQQLSIMLLDACDSVRHFEHAAFMAYHPVDLSPSTEPDSPGQDLPIVDVMDHPGIWAALDEGCNSSCHGSMWADNASRKLEKLGFSPTWIHREPKRYAGVGAGTTTHGLKRFMFALKLTTNQIIPGTVDSHEIPDSRAPLADQ